MPDPQRGNPNFFSTFKGKYAHTPASIGVWDTDTVMLSCTNDVQIIGDCTLTNYTALETITTLPEECRSGKVVKIPVIVDDGTERMVALTVNVDGTVTLPFDYASAVIYLSGVNFNISDNWYREVG